MASGGWSGAGHRARPPAIWEEFAAFAAISGSPISAGVRHGTTIPALGEAARARVRSGATRALDTSSAARLPCRVPSAGTPSIHSARAAGRTSQVTVVVGDGDPALRWLPRCIGCGETTPHVEERTASAARVVQRVRTTRAVTLSVPLCRDCAANDHRSEARMLGASLFVGLATCGLGRFTGGGSGLALGLGADPCVGDQHVVLKQWHREPP